MKNKNLYSVLEVGKDATDKEIKSNYRKLSFIYHPDKNRDKEAEQIFKNIAEAYNILSDPDKKSDYDLKSKYGKNYNEYFELFDIAVDFTYDDSKEKLEAFKRNAVLNIQIEIDDTFNGSIEYERWVKCKPCDGSGKDLSSKIHIKDNAGNILKTFDSDDGCDFCSGIGKHENGSICHFCFEEKNNVITNKGPIPINLIKKGDIVLTSENKYKSVIDTLSRSYSGIVYDINVAGITINGATPNHKFNIIRYQRNNYGRINKNKYSLLEIPASDILITDYLLYQTKSNVSKKSVNIPKSRNKIRKLNNIKIDDGFIKFIACYIAEGNTRGDRASLFTFHKDKDKELVDFVCWYGDNILKLKPNLLYRPQSWGDSVIKVEFFSSQLASFLNEFGGHLAANKYINDDIIGCSDEILIDTLLSCDGSKSGNTRTYTTVSKKLANQIFHLSLSVGHSASFGKEIEPYIKDGVSHQRTYRVYIGYKSESSRTRSNTRVVNEGICLNIKSIKKRHITNTMVYNLTVEDTHKYTIEGFLVNNCGGQGKVGLIPCKSCKGEKRVLGKQKLKGIKLDGKETKIEAMGHYSKEESGKCGYVMIIKKDQL